MAIKNLLVGYNGLPASEAALAGALLMRNYFDAHLTGLYAHGGSTVAAHLKPWMPAHVRDAVLELEKTSTREVEAKFRAGCGDAPAENVHWIESEAKVHGAAAAYARFFDLTVLGLHEMAEGFDRTHLEIHPDRVAFDSGRPVILFPAGFTGAVFDSKAVLAWDGGRAAARALGDAMGILETEQEVEIVSVGRAPLRSALPGVDVKTLLERHGVSVTVTELPAAGRSVAEVLVEHCTQVKASLLVMGAYEHTPLREDLFGGVTHDIAQRAKIPVLMSH